MATGRDHEREMIIFIEVVIADRAKKNLEVHLR